MCIGCAVAIGEPSDKGYNDGLNDGHKDGRSGLSHCVFCNLDNPYDNEEQSGQYVDWYVKGYNIGYSESVSKTEGRLYNKGVTNGYSDGYTDGYNGNDHSYHNMNYPTGWAYKFKPDYESGYKSGYDNGYSDGVTRAENEAPEDPGNESDNNGNTTDPVINKTVPASKEGPGNCMSSPVLGLGLKLPDGTITQKGDQLPTLYTWAEKDDKYEHHTTLTFPAEGTYTGCVIITPPQTAGVPLVESNFWNTPKGQRILQWRANAK